MLFELTPFFKWMFFLTEESYKGNRTVSARLYVEKKNATQLFQCG